MSRAIVVVWTLIWIEMFPNMDLMAQPQTSPTPPPAPTAQEQDPPEQAQPSEMTVDQKAQDFITYYETHVRPLEIEANLAWWNANTTGDADEYRKKVEAENRLNETLASEFRFEQLETILKEGVQDPLLARQLELLRLQYLSRQVPPELLQRMTAKANEIEQAFNVFRAQVGDEQLTDSQVRKELKTSLDSQRRKLVWEASKRVGEQVQAPLKELVLLRNQAAKHLGFDNFHAMQLTLSEQSPEAVLQLFDQLDTLTREPYRRAKYEIDVKLATRYKIPIEALRPWHYHDPFFQEPPDISDYDVDRVFAQVEIPAICEKFYAGIGLPVTEILKRSDLYEKPGKSPHAFCTDIDREGDVRVLANIVPNQYWMSTMLHELGHAVYSSEQIPETVPYMLRREAHILATEGIAMMFERFAGSAEWLAAMGIPVDDPVAYNAASQRNRRNRLLIFSRWCQVMLRFEMEMYRNPEQDLNKLWWDLVERYQLLKRPEDRSQPDYASKIHIVSAPAYYHNYLMGEMFACQLHARIATQVLQSPHPSRAIYYDDPRVGKFLREHVFELGASKPWQEMVRFATGAPLNAQAFAVEFSQ